MLKLEVGKTYLDGYGTRVKIVHYFEFGSYPFRSEARLTYKGNGVFVIDRLSRLDLVSEAIEPTPTVPVHTDGPKMTVRSLINGTIVIYLDKDCDPDLLITFAKGLKDV